MKSLFRLAALSAVVVLGSGCSLIANVQERIGSAVARYCEETPAARDALREYFNARTAPNRVEISCEGDAPAPAPAPPG